MHKFGGEYDLNRIKNWKSAFFILLGSIFLMASMLIGLTFYLVTSKQQELPENLSTVEDIKPFFTLVTSKSSINSWIHDELEKRGKKIDSLNYRVILDDYIYLKGELVIFNREVPFQMVFHPEVNAEGGLTLQEREISLGNLQLPGEIVLGLIGDQIDFPDWVKVNSDQQEIVVDIKRIELKKGMQLSVKQFDLKEDRLEFNIKRH